MEVSTDPGCELAMAGEEGAAVDASGKRGARKGHSSLRRQLRYWQPFNDW